MPFPIQGKAFFFITTHDALSVCQSGAQATPSLSPPTKEKHSGCNHKYFLGHISWQNKTKLHIFAPSTPLNS
jgi:hypothetical protein